MNDCLRGLKKLPRSAPKPTCCEWACTVIAWEEADKTFGPPETGWALSHDMSHALNVAFCPFCGTKLPETP